MRRSFLIVFLMGVVGFTRAQYQGANWPLCNNNLVLKFSQNGFERDSLPNSTYGFLANSSVSDTNGNLILYSFGNDARNKYGNSITGGCCLCQDTNIPTNCSSDPHFQGVMLLPRPGSSSQFYLFIKDMDTLFNEQPMRVTATLIDAAANNDSGMVLKDPVPIINDNILSDARMTACQHGNGRDWWLINHQYLTNKIYTHLITPDSIYGPFEQDIGLPGLEPDNAGWSIFSPNTNTFATATVGMGGITLLDFDRCTGTFSNFRIINTTLGDSGNYSLMAFSPSGRFLYATNARCIEQYDLQDTNIWASRVQLVHDTASYPLLGPLILMPDGKIYQTGATVIDSTLSVIDSPDVKGLACGFHLRSVVIPNSVEIQNVPNFPNYNLGPVIGSACDTITGLNEPQRATKEQILKIYPNPAADITTIDYGFTDWNKGPVSLEITNTLGQIIYTQPLPMYSGLQHLDISRFAMGIYNVSIKRMEATVAVARLVKE